MDEHGTESVGAKYRDRYEDAIKKLEGYLRTTPDGLLELRANSAELDIDPVVFADFSRSLAETNRRIKDGLIPLTQIQLAIKT